MVMFFCSPPVHGLEQDQAHTTYVILTVDVETPSPGTIGDLPLPDQLEAQIGKEGVGLSRMMDIADSFQVPITFFVDVYEYAKFGKDAIRRVVQTIDRRGHDVQLHTHPEWMGARIHMNEYSLAEQVEIIKQGNELLKEWLGRFPVVHRTGAYAANEDTMEALKRNRIYFDSSWFYSNPDAHGLSALNYPVNAVAERKGIVQFPVTVFRLGEWASLFNWKLPALSHYKRVDIDSCDLQQLRSILAQHAQNHTDVVTVSLHSYSFISWWDRKPENRQADAADINDFREILRQISQSSTMQVISAHQFSDLYTSGRLQLSPADFVPAAMDKVNLLAYLWQYVGMNLSYCIWFGLVIAVIVFTTGLVQYRRKKSARSAMPGCCSAGSFAGESSGSS